MGAFQRQPTLRLRVTARKLSSCKENYIHCEPSWSIIALWPRPPIRLQHFRTTDLFGDINLEFG
ncbi:hypothetical protein Mal65_04820 [Crateriforma conspicua]|nr:hypothetical protein Mal65_04820 [Crateriforma conspicua]